MVKKHAKPITVRDLFLGQQEQMLAVLSSARRTISHSTTHGDVAEECWRKMLERYLPKRYRIEKAFVVDADGNISEQLDGVVFDQQYSPFLLNHDGAFYVPAESVYAVLEVKPELNANYIAYAGKKAASVRRLRRTSAPITYVKGVYPPKKPFRILAGIVAARSSWKPAFGPGFQSAIRKRVAIERLDLGCILQAGGFEVRYKSHSKAEISTSQPDESLIFFFLSLLALLQKLGTAPAIDIREYAKGLKRW